MNIPAVDSFFTIYSGFLFFFRFIIFLFRTDKAASYTPSGTVLTPFQESGQFQCFVQAVMLYTVHQSPSTAVPVAYKPGIASLLLGNLTLSPSALSAFFLQILLSFSEEFRVFQNIHTGSG